MALLSFDQLTWYTLYIGFHHCQLELRETFLGSIRDVMKLDGYLYLIVRDHNVHNQKMLKMVALAHDVFNMGTFSFTHC